MFSTIAFSILFNVDGSLRSCLDEKKMRVEIADHDKDVEIMLDLRKSQINALRCRNTVSLPGGKQCYFNYVGTDVRSIVLNG